MRLTNTLVVYLSKSQTYDQYDGGFVIKYFAKYMWKLNKVIIVRLNIQFVPNLRLNKEIYGDFKLFYFSGQPLRVYVFNDIFRTT